LHFDRKGKRYRRADAKLSAISVARVIVAGFQMMQDWRMVTPGEGDADRIAQRPHLPSELYAIIERCIADIYPQIAGIDIEHR
jgi:hypothetical protein